MESSPPPFPNAKGQQGPAPRGPALYPTAPDLREEAYYPPTGQPGYPPPGAPMGQPGTYFPAQGQGQQGPAPNGGPALYPTAPYPHEGPYYPPTGQPGYPPQGAPMGQPGAYFPAQGQVPVILGQPQTTVLTNSAATPRLKESTVRMQCPECRKDIMTCPTYETGTLTWLICVGLIIFGLGCGCCLIPFCIDSCKDVVHKCPNCKHVIGRYNRLS